MATTNERTAGARATHFSTPNDTDIVAVRVFDAPRRLVWDAHTKAEHVARWQLGPDGWSMPVCEIDLRPSGRWHFVWRNDATGEQFGMEGVYKEIVPHERIVSTEGWGPEWPEAVNTYVFTEENGRTTLTVTSRFPSREAREKAIATGMEKGWAQSNDRLDGYLATLA